MTRVEKGGFLQLGVQDKTGSVIVEKLKEDTDESTLGLEGREKVPLDPFYWSKVSMQCTKAA